MFSYDKMIGISQVDDKGFLTPGALFGEFQDCAEFQSSARGVGMDYLLQHSSGWVVAYYEMIVNRIPKSSEKLTIGTIPYRIKGYLGERNFIIKDETGEVIIAAESMWVYMDRKNARMAHIPDEVIKAYEPDMEERYDINPKGRKLKMPDDLTHRQDFEIRRCDLDYNGHVNNTVYIRLAEEYIPSDRQMKRMRVLFTKSVLYGEKIHAYTKADDEAVYVALRNDAGEDAVTIEIT